ncbi:hypothetical protein MsAg5_04130 [Methanosarcinaceae archaeon Ag5]|uniref:Abi family protein n=2 Tax=Methanolapillus africanus TaxID=3028297 RepID=A0AAE4MK10_9EURY|nr:hypothetical protein [Methanosarcinaceae archaeon Ag5]
MFAFQDSNRYFKPGTFFENVIELYNFDSAFRSLVFNAIEKIEIALRAQVIFCYAMQYGENWYRKSRYFKDSSKHLDFLSKHKQALNSSKELFIIHHFKHYPPLSIECWKSLEILSFGELSKFFENLNADPCKTDIKDHFKMSSLDMLENWFHCISIIRNICAHHGRLWNRTVWSIMLPINGLPGGFVQNMSVSGNKMYASLCCIQYLLNAIDPQNDFKQRFFDLINKYPSVKLNEMGFPPNWRNESFWR